MSSIAGSLPVKDANDSYEKKAMLGISDGNLNESQLGSGLTDSEAVEIIMKDLEELLQLKEDHFKEHKDRCRQQVRIVLCKLIFPETLLTLAYTGITIFNTAKLIKFKDEITEADSLLAKHFVLVVVLLILIIFNMALRVSKLSAEVLNVDTEVRRTLTEFQHTKWDDEDGSFEDMASKKEFSFYQDCFTLTWRNKRWRHVPTNTLAKGDIIKLLPGEVAPAMIKRIGTATDCSQNDSQNNEEPNDQNILQSNQGGQSTNRFESN